MSILNILVWWPCCFTALRKSNDELQPTETNRIEFVMQLLDCDNWDRLSEIDLNHNKVRHAGSSPYLREVQERLLRKRYTNNAVGVAACCRPPDLRCSSI